MRIYPAFFQGLMLKFLNLEFKLNFEILIKLEEFHHVLEKAVGDEHQA
jgi:hypothetical protein